MKKNHYLLIVMLVLGYISVAAQDVTINTKEEFKSFLASTDTYEGKTVKLAANLDFTNETDIHGIAAFKGIFDGQGHTISGITTTTTSDPTAKVQGQGLFRTTDGATISNLNLDKIKITLVAGTQNSAILIGSAANSNIKNCSITDSELILANNVQKCGFFSGTLNSSSIENCYIEGSKISYSTTANIPSAIGLLAGQTWVASGAQKEIKNCCTTDGAISTDITATSKGHFIGNKAGAGIYLLKNCYAQEINGIALYGAIQAGSIDASTSSIKDASFFADPESAWILNTTNSTVTNSKIWSHNGTNPIFADATNGAIVKAGAIDGETQTYAKGNEVLATDFKYITFDTTNSEITDYSTLAINPTNPNALIYLPEDATLNKANVVIGDACANLVLTDGHNFVCPTSFTATQATYTRNCYIDGGWETIVLPFSVTDIKSGETSVKGDYTVEGYTSTSGTTVKFTELTNITDWKADNAYILKHNSAETGTQECTFEGTGTIAATPTDADFTGTYTLISNDLATGNYALNAAGTEFGPLAASTATATIPAFRAYLKKGNGPNPAKYSVEHDNGATGINNAQQASTIIYADGESIIINSEKAQTINVYSIDGRKAYNTIAEEGTTTINGLPKGIYIVNNQKVILK